jgi:hypothetical protein
MSGYQRLASMALKPSALVFEPFALVKEIREMSLKEYKELNLNPNVEEKVINKTVKIVRK